MQTQVLVDNGARVNSVMWAYVRKHNLGVHPISDLDHSLNPFQDHIPGLGSHQMESIGFTLVCVQIEGMPHYDKMCTRLKMFILLQILQKLAHTKKFVFQISFNQ